MKHTIKIFLAICFLGAASCEKDGIHHIAENQNLSNKALVKVYNAVIASPTNFVYIDNVKVTGSVVGYTGLFPASATYAAIDPGAKSIKITDTAGTPKLDITVSGNLEAGKYYSLFFYDSLKTAKSKLVEDDIQIPADTATRLRFANLIFSSVTIPNLDIYSQILQKNIFSNVAVGDVTSFITHPSKRADTFALRATGTTVNLNTLIFTPGEKRSYTLIARGRYQTTSGTTARTLTLMTNY